ncbi:MULTISPECIES: ABC transporter permease [Pseudothermotoga]|jgi:peptide/nickel transport system permease protein|uniref:Binding-protein-dependent transport systems inner membrane component n=1 Tax=Pseudothermotoga lettingae (strain ATCC BAA-301 / DSM 14385 / NBRC 107922 / TMO) TaxID=416591 RepID=A8F5I6_PSELT|nr:MULTISPECIES: ABC transporter permease [Pseudothermotoga]ABV33420.1 binding-protein-dependent transport systems inner membrane component [Pseudothermotoga lettingae TMO]GLI49666.1 peptide ABC transporter permease [Pseudothermotoga lettingae TMO]HBJ80272.1 ABC transporter permease [Pseudothermotoga sp.]HBT25935.1 ABC transporter permease [Pseudothermotoga sp.]
MKLTSFILKRLLLMILVLLGVSVIVFVVARVIPADPVGAILGGNAPPDLIDDMRHRLGLDKPLINQFLDYMFGLLKGDLGVSLKSNRPVTTDIADFFPATLELAIAATFVSILLGITLGIFSAVYRNRFIDHFSRVFSILGVSMPVFWTGLLLLLLFYYKLGWLPGTGRLSLFTPAPDRITGLLIIDSLLTLNFEAFKDALSHIILPAVVLGYSATASIARITRSSMLDVLRQDYIRTAKAKGIGKRLVIYRHALRNALIPVVTIIGLTFGGLLEGAVLTETIFGWPGLGRYIVNALLFLDYPAVMGGTLFVAVVYSLVNLVVDIIYAVLDPRMRV